jgi:hypothetical protein
MVREGLYGFLCDGLGGFFEVVGDFKNAGDVGGEGGDVFRYVGPVDTFFCWGDSAGPEVVIFLTVVVVKVEFGDARLEELKGFVDTFAGFGSGEVGVADVETDANAVEVTDLDDFKEVLGGGDFVLEVFEEDADAEGVSEGFEVLNGCEGVLECASVPGVVLLAKMQGTGGDGDLLGGLKGALDLVHGGDAAGLFGVDEVQVRGDVAGPLGVGAVADVQRLVERAADIVRAEPCGDVADGGAVGVVEVVAGGEDFDGVGAAAVEGVEQARVQALRKKDMGGDSGLHHLLRYSSGASRSGEGVVEIGYGGSARIGTRTKEYETV